MQYFTSTTTSARETGGPLRLITAYDISFTRISCLKTPRIRRNIRENFSWFHALSIRMELTDRREQRKGTAGNGAIGSKNWRFFPKSSIHRYCSMLTALVSKMEWNRGVSPSLNGTGTMGHFSGSQYADYVLLVLSLHFLILSFMQVSTWDAPSKINVP